MFELTIQMKNAGRTASQYEAYRSFIAQMKELTRDGIADQVLSTCWIQEYRFDPGVEEHLIAHLEHHITSPAHGLPMRLHNIVAHAHHLGWMKDGDWVEHKEGKGGSG